MSEVDFIVGENVVLRGLTQSDVTLNYEQWLNDENVTRFMETGRFPVTQESISEFVSAMASGDSNLLLGIFLKDTEEHVGNLKIGPINWVHRSAELGIMIGSPAARGRGVGTESIRLAVRHAFERLNLQRISLGVVETNEGALRCYEKVGFVREGLYRDAVISGAESYNIVRMGLLANEFKL